MRLLTIFAGAMAYRRHANKASSGPGVYPVPTPAPARSTSRDQPPAADRTKTGILAAVTAAVLVAVVVTAGMVLGRTGSSPQASTSAVTAATSPASSYSPTPTPTPTKPAIYGDTGLAGTIAQEHGHDSMSALCADGTSWACDVDKVEATAGLWFVTVGAEPFDGNARAKEILDQAPKSISGVSLQCGKWGRTFIVIPKCGYVTRSSK